MLFFTINTDNQSSFMFIDMLSEATTVANGDYDLKNDLNDSLLCSLAINWRKHYYCLFKLNRNDEDGDGDSAFATTTITTSNECKEKINLKLSNWLDKLTEGIFGEKHEINMNNIF